LTYKKTENFANRSAIMILNWLLERSMRTKRLKRSKRPKRTKWLEWIWRFGYSISWQNYHLFLWGKVILWWGNSYDCFRTV